MLSSFDISIHSDEFASEYEERLEVLALLAEIEESEAENDE
jgi:hypothetical protein